jgi:predicted Zn-dependent protease
MAASFACGHFFVKEGRFVKAGLTLAHARDRFAPMRRFLSLFAACGLALALGACAQNQASGRSQFTAFVSPAEEMRIGREEHPKVLEQYGGEYNNPRVKAYVQRIGERLAARSELAGSSFTFTVLNSDISNAFALPGGYVYISRGLLGLMGSEAELASVLGHEIGHVTARHTAERLSRGQAANIFTNILGIGVAVLTGSGDAGSLAAQATGTGAGMWLAGFSREQEFEADKLGVRYMASEGYDPAEAAEMLAKLGAETRLTAKMLGRDPESADSFSIMQTHPRTADRVVAATEAARAQGMIVAANPRQGVAEYFEAIDGLSVLGDRESGFVRGNVFLHPALRIRFEAPKGFRIENGSDAVSARGPSGATMRVDAVRTRAATNPRDFLTGVWARGQTLRNVETITVNGLPAATAPASLRTQNGSVAARLVVIQHPDGAFYRMLLAAPAEVADRFTDDFRRTTYSFRALSEAEARDAQPLRMRIATVRPGDTQETLARRMATDDGFELERFQLINGLKQGEALAPGTRVKIIADR